VGHRIVVRRLVPGETGPSGGPAMTDVLGICTSWGEAACTVQPESGPEVRIPLAEVVTGKPVPPRASVRQRVSPHDAQVHGFALFPDLETYLLGDWVIRKSATATARRANSVLAFGPSGVPGDVDAVVAHYDRPVAAVLPDSAEERLFRDCGWDLESGDADTSFQVAGTATAMRALPASALEVELDETPGHVTARIGDVASGYAGTDGDWLGIGGLWVDPAARRQGLAFAIIGAFLDWGASQGATTAYLQVLGDNTAALRLYDRLGFREHHRYRYLALAG
jgi:RimJ/RimL family protein N-acetyltransferase